jgi:rhodanese-related sulfurtransferase
MKRVFLTLVATLTLIGSNAQTNSKSYGLMLKGLYKNTVPTISCSELQKVQKNVVLLDTRPKTEFNVSHLPNARWVGYNDFELGRVSDLPKNSAIVVYCSVGYRSERIGEKLLAAGYINVRNLYGSIFEWVNQGHEVVDSTQQPTKRVHAYSPAWGIWLKKGQKVYR